MLKRQWQQIIDTMARKAVLARGVLADARPVAVERDCVVVGFDREFPEEMERFERGRDRKALELTMGNVLGRKVKASFTLVEGGLDREDVAESASEAEAEEAPSAPTDRPRTTRDWAKESSVKKTLDAFEGSIVEVRE
jgi:hypothetical protein